MLVWQIQDYGREYGRDGSCHMVKSLGSRRHTTAPCVLDDDMSFVPVNPYSRADIGALYAVGCVVLDTTGRPVCNPSLTLYRSHWTLVAVSMEVLTA